MARLDRELKIRLKGAGKVAVLAVGSDLRADDAAGLLVAAALEKRLRRLKRRPRLKVFRGETAPENLTGQIRAFGPTHLILVDTVEMGQKPGTIILISPELISGASFSTHLMPVKILARYLLDSLGSAAVIVGIQPRSLVFGRKPSRAVQTSAAEVAQAIIAAVTP